MIINTAKVPLFEIDGNNTDTVDTPSMEVISHWNDDGLVVLKVEQKSGTGTVTVRASDLKAAIANAQNSGARG